MRTAHWVALCLAQIIATAALAERGVVKATNGMSYEGDVEETVTQVVIRRNKTEIRINRDEVSSIQYLSTDTEEIRKRWLKLDNTDVDGRLKLSRFAFERGQYELARSIAEEAGRIDPNNREAVDLQEVITGQILMELRAKRNKDQAAAAKRSPYALPETYLNEQDINAIRQAELQPRDDGRVRFRFQNDVRRRFVQQYGYNPQTFAQFSAFEQAMAMVREGDAAIRKDVVVFDDPTVIREFRALHRNIITSCATATCHGSTLGGNFILFPNLDSEPALYTNFHLLSRYSRVSQDQKTGTGATVFGSDSTRRYMLDRHKPEQSLLLQYGLPQTMTDTPHPQVPHFRPMFTRVGDPMYNKILDFIGLAMSRVEVRADVSYVSPIEQQLQAATKPATPATTRPAAKQAARL